MNLAGAIGLVFPLVMVAAMITDARRFEIPNSLPLALVLAWPVVAVAGDLPGLQIAWACAIACGLLLLGIALYAFAILGGGDAKLIAAAALWTGAGETGSFLLYTALLGGLVALGVMLARHQTLLPAALARRTLVTRLRGEAHVPYALAIGPAGLLVYPRLPFALGLFG